MSEQLYRKFASCQNCVKLQPCVHPHNLCNGFELVGKREAKPKKTKSLCSGCSNRWYDHDIGLIQSGGKGCWSYKTAKVVLKSNIYSSSQLPPYALRWKLDCFRRA